MYVVFQSNFAVYDIVCRRYKPCGFLDLFGPIAGATNPITWHFYGNCVS